MGAIIITLPDGTLREFQAEYLNQERAEAWQGFIFGRAWEEFVPFADFLMKLGDITPEFRALANVKFRQAILNVHATLAATKMLGILVCSEDFITESNAQEAYPQLASFIAKPAEIVCESLSQVTAARAEAGKPPIGVKTTTGG